MDTDLTASVATFRVFSPDKRASNGQLNPAVQPPKRNDRMATTQVTEGPLVLSQLTGNEMTYLQVNSFTRAIMPRARIWRVSSNELVIPGSFTNFWLITLSGPAKAIARLDHVLKKLCKYEISSADEDAGTESVSDDELPGETEESKDSRGSLDSPRTSGLVANARETISQGRMAERLSGNNEYNNPGYMPQFKKAPSNSISSRKTQSEHASFTEDSLLSDSSVILDAGPSNLGQNMLDEVVLATPPISPPSQPSSSERQLKDNASLTPRSPGPDVEARSQDDAEILHDLQIPVPPQQSDVAIPTASEVTAASRTENSQGAEPGTEAQLAEQSKGSLGPVQSGWLPLREASDTANAESLDAFDGARKASQVKEKTLEEAHEEAHETLASAPAQEDPAVDKQSLSETESLALQAEAPSAKTTADLGNGVRESSTLPERRGKPQGEPRPETSTAPLEAYSPLEIAQDNMQPDQAAEHVADAGPNMTKETEPSANESRQTEVKAAGSKPEESKGSVSFQHSSLAAVLKSQQPKFEPRFSHPLIPSSQITWYHQTSSANSSPRSPRLSLQRRELTTLGPGSLHQDVTTVGGYIGLKAVKGILKKT